MHVLTQGLQLLISMLNFHAEWHVMNILEILLVAANWSCHVCHAPVARMSPSVSECRTISYSCHTLCSCHVGAMPYHFNVTIMSCWRDVHVFCSWPVPSYRCDGKLMSRRMPRHPVKHGSEKFCAKNLRCIPARIACKGDDCGGCPWNWCTANVSPPELLSDEQTFCTARNASRWHIDHHAAVHDLRRLPKFNPLSAVSVHGSKLETVVPLT